MGKKLKELVAVGGDGLRVFPGPWKGELVLACGKCQRKLKGDSSSAAVANLKKTFKTVGRERGGGPKIKVISVPCLKLCPKGAVTVCTRQQIARSECCLLKTAEDVEKLYRGLLRGTEQPSVEREGLLPGRPSPR